MNKSDKYFLSVDIKILLEELSKNIEDNKEQKKLKKKTSAFASSTGFKNSQGKFAFNLNPPFFFNSN